MRREPSVIGQAFKDSVGPEKYSVSRPVKLAARARRVPLYQNSITVVGSKAARDRYFKDFQRWNRGPQIRVHDLPLGNSLAFQTETYEMDKRYIEMQNHGSMTYYHMPNNHGIRLLLVQKLPDFVANPNEAVEITRLTRICRAAGVVVFYGVESMQEFQEKQWGGEPSSNADLTQLILDDVGDVVKIEDTFYQIPQDLLD